MFYPFYLLGLQLPKDARFSSTPVQPAFAILTLTVETAMTRLRQTSFRRSQTAKQNRLFKIYRP